MITPVEITVDVLKKIEQLGYDEKMRVINSFIKAESKRLAKARCRIYGHVGRADLQGGFFYKCDICDSKKSVPAIQHWTNDSDFEEGELDGNA